MDELKKIIESLLNPVTDGEWDNVQKRATLFRQRYKLPERPFTDEEFEEVAKTKFPNEETENILKLVTEYFVIHDSCHYSTDSPPTPQGEVQAMLWGHLMGLVGRKTLTVSKARSLLCSAPGDPKTEQSRCLVLVYQEFFGFLAGYHGSSGIFCSH